MGYWVTMGQLLDRRAEGGSILCSRSFFGRLAQIENRVLLRSQKTSEQKNKDGSPDGPFSQDELYPTDHCFFINYYKRVTFLSERSHA